jgi:UDP-N-acetyl-2-amino-2-deoxyglucuronate dehydrogenase
MGIRRHKIAVIGLGNVCESHLTAYSDLDEVELVGVVEPRVDRCREVATKYGVPGFPSCELLFEKVQPDIACVLTPASSHRVITEQCAAAGVHVLCEKPMAVTLEDAYAMADACRAAGVLFFYGASYRHLPAIEAARCLIEAGAIGAVRMLTESVIAGQGAQAYQPKSAAHYPEGGPGGWGYGLVDHGIHMLDVFPWLCGSSVSSIWGRGDRTGTVAHPEFAMMTLRNGATGFVNYDGSTRSTELPWEGVFSEGRQWIPNRGWVGDVGEWEARPGHICVYGDEGALRIFHYANKLYVNRSGQMVEQQLAGRAAPWHFGRQLQSFCRSIACGERVSSSAEDGIRAVQALQAIYQSQESGTLQSLVHDDRPRTG